MREQYSVLAPHKRVVFYSAVRRFVENHSRAIPPHNFSAPPLIDIFLEITDVPERAVSYYDVFSDNACIVNRPYHYSSFILYAAPVIRAWLAEAVVNPELFGSRTDILPFVIHPSADVPALYDVWVAFSSASSDYAGFLFREFPVDFPGCGIFYDEIVVSFYINGVMPVVRYFNRKVVFDLV